MNLFRRTNRNSATFRQAGLASVELVLIAPILALFMYFMFQSLKSAYVWEDRIIGARNAAWKTELYGGPGPDLGGLARAALEGKLASKIANPGDIENIHDINVISYSQSEGVKATEAFHNLARNNVRAGQADVIRRWTGILDEEDNKFNVTSGTANSWFISILGKYAISEPTIAETTHYVDFARGWENTDDGMKVGYDVALKQKLQPRAFYKYAIK